MSLTDVVNLPEEYNWDKPDKHDPNSIGKGWSFSEKEGICAKCFDRIICPIINGIWYHRDRWSVNEKDHAPEPASIPLQLFHYFMLPPSFSNKKVKTKKCMHSKWWSSILDFPKFNEGIHRGHYYRTDYISLCGKVMGLKIRQRKERAEFPVESSKIDCSKCLEKLIKLKVITTKLDRRYSHSHYRTYHVKWNMKKLPKQFMKDEIAKYMKVLK